jgi:hypothetical protein
MGVAAGVCQDCCGLGGTAEPHGSNAAVGSEPFDQFLSLIPGFGLSVC